MLALTSNFYLIYHRVFVSDFNLKLLRQVFDPTKSFGDHRMIACMHDKCSGQATDFFSVFECICMEGRHLIFNNFRYCCAL